MGAQVVVTEIDPICALQAAWKATASHRSRTPSPGPTSTSPPPATRTSSPLEHMEKMKDQAIVCNIGHFDNEIQVDKLNASRGRKVNIKPQVDKYTFPDGTDLSAGRRPPGEPRLRHRPPELRDVEQLHQPGAGPDRPVEEQGELHPRRVYVLPKHLDEEVARLHLEKIGAKLTGSPCSGPGRLVERREGCVLICVMIMVFDAT
jgi:adenosylhomocysteinase